MMLVLTGKTGDNILIGNAADEVTVTVLEVNGNQVRLGFDAPMHISIDREKIRQRKIDDPDYSKDQGD